MPIAAIVAAIAHEHEERRGQLGLVPGARLELLPHQGVAAGARRRRLGSRRGVGHDDLDRLDGDGAVAVDAAVLEPLDDVVRGFPRDVAQHDVAGGLGRRAGAAHDVDDAGRRAEPLEDRVGAVRRDDQPQVQHAAHPRGQVVPVGRWVRAAWSASESGRAAGVPPRTVRGPHRRSDWCR